MSLAITAVAAGGGALVAGGTGALVGAVVGSGIASGISSKKGAEAQAEAALQAGETSYAATLKNIEAQEKALDKILESQESTLDKQIALNAPWEEAGLAALENVRTRIDAGEQFNFEADPGYQFRKSEMAKAVERRASVRGRVSSPATDKEIARYVGDLASQEYQNAFNRYQAERDRSFREQAFESAAQFDIANLGRGATASNVGAIGAGGAGTQSAISSTAGNIAQMTQAGANALSQSYLNRGEAKAAGYAGQAASVNQGIENMLMLGFM